MALESGNVFTVRTQRSGFLSNEQTMDIIHILSNKLSRGNKDLITKVIKNKFYSLEDRPYWKQFKLQGNGVSFHAEKNATLELAAIKQDILAQAELMGL